MGFRVRAEWFIMGYWSHEGESGKSEKEGGYVTNAIVNRNAHCNAFAARIREKHRTNCIPSQTPGWAERRSGQPPERSPKCRRHILTNATYRRKRHARHVNREIEFSKRDM